MEAASPAPSAPDRGAAFRRALGANIGLAALLVVAVYVGGLPGLSAPWMQGDEFIFIADNPDVNPAAAAPDVTPGPLPARLGALFTKIHDDLYQPIPIATYALEWALAGGDATSFRRTDVLLHALNALLVWAALTMILRHTPGVDALTARLIGWCGALVWALHPVLVTAWAADMGRTHLLSATFSFVALLLYMTALARRADAWYLAALVALVLAMLCKPVVGWVLVAFMLEAICHGWRHAVRSPRPWFVLLICAAFACLTVQTSSEAGLLEDASKGLFGDPVSRSLLAVWIYARNIIAPAWLAFWYIPDPRTGWTFALVWAGLALALASLVHAAVAWRRSATRSIALGWAWWWALLLPVLGLVGAREVAAVDRYLYQPLVGVVLVVAVYVAHAVAARPRARRIVPAATGVLALVMLVWNLPLTLSARSNIQRAERLVALNPGDPRALEALAAAYDFARNHPMPGIDQEYIAAGRSQYAEFTRRAHDTLSRATAVENLPAFFPGPEDRAPFHRRLAYRLLGTGDAEASLAEARRAADLQPDAFMTHKRLAHAYQALGRLADACAAYERCEAVLPDEPRTQAIHYTDFGNLLLFRLEDAPRACEKFAAAQATGRAPFEARVGTALCEIRFGEGARGYALISEYLAANPGDIQAGLVLAEYHLRSHHYREAALVYDAILRDMPVNYSALRGYQEVCFHTGQMDEAILAWQDALGLLPDEPAFQAFHVWALALGAPENAASAAEELLDERPVRFAHLALMFDALRGDDLERAREHIDRAAAAPSIGGAREFARAEAAIRVLRARRALPPSAVLAQAELALAGSLPGVAARLRPELERYVESQPRTERITRAQELLGALAEPTTAPAAP
jgi:tetratricopeptide (TPR) repeat protein